MTVVPSPKAPKLGGRPLGSRCIAINHGLGSQSGKGEGGTVQYNVMGCGDALWEQL
jgi:hypothetical protein